MLGFDAIGFAEPAYEATFDELADYLTTGYWEDNNETPAAFDTGNSNVITVSLSGLDTIGRRFAEAAMEAWEMVADLDFQIVLGSADITFTDNGSLTAYSTSETSGGYITSAIVNVSTDWVRTPYVDVAGDYDDYGLQTYIHELGHALGLGHQGAYNGSASYGSDNLFTNDSWMYSVMSYFSQTDNVDTDGTLAYVMTAMMADIIAIQDLYGAAREGSVTWGQTTWGHNSNLGTYLDDLFDAATGGTQSYVGSNVTTFTIYDAGGIDMINLSPLEVDVELNMASTASSSVGDLSNVIHIARGTVIENAFLGTGDDVVRGNVANNWIRSGGGDDLVFGYLGNDRLISGYGSDIVHGGDGNDLIRSGHGNDRVYAGRGNDRIEAGFGNDVIFTGLGNDVIYGGNGSDVIRGNQGGDRIFSGEQNDTVYGGDGNDYLVDGAGNDRIFGGIGFDTIVFSRGADTATGGRGTDYFVFGLHDGSDRVTDFTTGTDVLRLDDALWSGTLTATQVIDTYAEVDAFGQTVFTFDTGDVLTLSGVSDLDALASSLVII